jgi:hypothetical protein
MFCIRRLAVVLFSLKLMSTSMQINRSLRFTSLLLFFSLLCFYTHTGAQELSIIPAPSSITTKSGSFVLTNSSSLSYSDQNDVKKVADYLRSKLQPATGFSFAKSQTSGAGTIALVLNSKSNDHSKFGPWIVLCCTNPCSTFTSCD